MSNTPTNPCGVYECIEPGTIRRFDTNYCIYHSKNGMFSGESYEQYQIIESDFIDFNRSVPLSEDHFEVHSPLLRDIIIRSCVQLEIFFKEWARYECSDKSCALYTEAESKSGSKSWTINSYHYFARYFSGHRSRVFVLPLNKHIEPFANWSMNNAPQWWTAYNKIKHDGHLHKAKANYENALLALAALFKVHCVYDLSRSYLRDFVRYKVIKEHGNVKIITEDITTPIDSRKYLFREPHSGGITLADIKGDAQIDELNRF